MSPEILIRQARPGDKAAIHDAHMRSIREVCVKDHGEDEIRGWGYRPLENRWVRAIEEDFVWVATLNEIIYGLGYLRLFDEGHEKQAHLHALYLTPEILGRGVGYRLAKLMLDTAREHAVRRVTLESSLTAHAFYKRLGFVDTDELKKVDINGHAVSYYPMALELGAR